MLSHRSLLWHCQIFVITAKVMVGGAALTQEYAQEAGADFYASDGVKALNIANKIVGEN